MSEAATNPDRIQQDLDETRSRMDERLSAIQQRLSPGQILDDLMGYVKGSEGGAFANDLVANLRGNPIPAALTGIGLAWLMASGPKTLASATQSPARSPSTTAWTTPAEFDDHFSRIESSTTRSDGENDTDYTSRINDARGAALGIKRSGDEAHDTFAGRVDNAMTAAKDALASTARSVSEKAGDATQRVSDLAGTASDQVSQMAKAAPQMTGDLYASIVGNPVLLGAVGLAVGAMLGAAIPQSDAETGALESVATNARETASGLAQQVVDKGGELAQSAMKTASDGTKDAGIGGEQTLSSVIESVRSGELLDKAKKVATDVLEKTTESVSKPS